MTVFGQLYLSLSNVKLSSFLSLLTLFFMILKKQFFSFLLIVSFFTSVFCQSPRNLTSNITWDNDNNSANGNQRTVSIAAIEAAFTNARRLEEAQFSLSGSPLGSLTLPSNFLSLSYDAQALFLLNAERACRAGVNYGDGACKGWVFEGLEATIDNVAQTYANLMISANCSGHECDGGGQFAPFTRISNAMGVSCTEFISRGENIASYYTSASSNNMIVVQAVYDWIYDDGPSWGHREACLLQDRNLAGDITYGFDDNHGATGTEGFIGIGTAGANNGAYYAPFSPKPVWLDRSDVVVLNFFDPIPSGCSYVVLPVELLSFNAKAQQNGIELSWTTAEEINLKGYEIERSEDGKNFKTIDFVSSKTQNGKTDYSFLDPSVKQNFIYFYRLRMVDYDGKFNHSPVRSAIQKGQKTNLSIYPNPTSSIVHITTGSDAEEQIEISNLMGEIVLRTTIIDSKSLDLGTLSAGIYVIRTSNGAVQRITKY